MPRRDRAAFSMHRFTADADHLPRRLLAHVLGAGAYLAVAARTTGLGPVPLAIALAAIACGGMGPRRRHPADVAMPFLALAAFYHWLGWLRPSVTARGVHVSFPYWFDKAVFGVGKFAERLSCNEVFATHHAPTVDFIAGLAYLSFLPLVFVFAVYLVMLDRGREGVTRTRRFGWTFFGINVAGFVTYILCPVAPPWYVTSQGFGPVNPSTKASSAALARWDAMTGIPYFDHFYGQATEVFGAFPSLHCAYPMLLTLFAWEVRRYRLAALLGGYELFMCFSAVYLQHHYVSDVVAGAAYATAGYGLGKMWAMDGGRGLGASGRRDDVSARARAAEDVAWHERKIPGS